MRNMNNKLKKILGYMMIIISLILLFVASVVEYGLITALILWVVALIIFGLLFIGIELVGNSK